MKRILTALLILGAAIGVSAREIPSAASPIPTQPLPEPTEPPPAPVPACETDTCWSCARPAAGIDGDGDGVPDRLEYDLAHKYFPSILLQHYDEDLSETYLYTGWAIPYTVQPRQTGVCNEAQECLEIRYGIAYRNDRGDDIWGDSHPGDSEFYVALVMRTASWSTAAVDADSWQMIRDFTAAHWGGLADSRHGAYGYCPPSCHSWDNNEQACRDESLCAWFPGMCYGHSSSGNCYSYMDQDQCLMAGCSWEHGMCMPRTQDCSDYWEEGPCYFAGCEWEDTSCGPRIGCYNPSPLSSARSYYASEGKHALYHTDGECDSGGFWGADDCPYNQFNMRDYKAGKLQNIGSAGNHSAFDTVIQHPDGCALYGVWSGAAFAEATAYSTHFQYGFNWSLPPDTSGELPAGYYRCVVDVDAGSHSCVDGIVTLTTISDIYRVVEVDLSDGYQRLDVIADVCNPSGWVMHFSDSPSGDGGGGDGSDTEHDAEAHLNDTSFSFWGTYDYDRSVLDPAVLEHDVIPATGCFQVHWSIEEDRVTFDHDGDPSDSARIALDSFRSFELAPYDEPDAEDPGGAFAELWYAGLNRTVGRQDRVGSGVIRACFVLSESANPDPGILADLCAPGN